MKPKTRDLAERLNDTALPILYDYIFRLTSGSVHLNISSFLKMGWGKKEDGFLGVKNPKLRLKPMNAYYECGVKVYSTFLFLFYFEYFENLNNEFSDKAGEISALKALLFEGFRWPEIVTFEELNVERPNLSFFQKAFLPILSNQSSDQLRDLTGLNKFFE